MGISIGFDGGVVVTTAEAIARSVSHTEIVTVDYDAATAEELAAESEDSVPPYTTASGQVLAEYWGTTEGGDEWRVHVLYPEPDHE